MLPEDVNKLSLEDQQQMYMLEQAMMTQEISIPVYFSRHTQELETVARDLFKVRGTNSQRKQPQASAMDDIVNTVSANGYQVVISGGSHAANKQSKINILQGELSPSATRLKTDDGSVSAGKLPIIIVTAQMQTLGLINQAVTNEDLSVLMTLVDSFSKLYSSATTAPKYRLMFLVTESNHLLNFQGTKKWLDANFDDNAQTNNVEFVLCLDSIGRQQSLSSDALFMHVSKPPKEGTQTSAYFKSLKTTAKRYGSGTVDGVHKKINLADVLLAWEHERFSMKRLPAFTLSNLKNHKDPMRSTVFQGESEERAAVLVQNTKIIAESLANYVYKLDGEGEIFTGTMDITADSLRPWAKMASIATSNDLKNGFEKYLKNVKVTQDKPDPREPDFMLFDGQEAKLNVYHVKPAIFDLFLTILIAAYLTTTYFAILHFPKFYTAVCKLTGSATSSYVQPRPKLN